MPRGQNCQKVILMPRGKKLSKSHIMPRGLGYFKIALGTDRSDEGRCGMMARMLTLKGNREGGRVLDIFLL